MQNYWSMYIIHNWHVHNKSSIATMQRWYSLNLQDKLQGCFKYDLCTWVCTHFSGVLLLLCQFSKLFHLFYFFVCKLWRLLSKTCLALPDIVIIIYACYQKYKTLHSANTICTTHNTMRIVHILGKCDSYCL